MTATEAVPYGAKCRGQRPPRHGICRSNMPSDETELTATQTMVELLLCANRAVGNDQERAKQLIERVVEILRTTIQGRDDVLPSHVRPGGLPPWGPMWLLATGPLEER